MRIKSGLIVLVLCFTMFKIHAHTYPNVLFENSVMPGSYGHSLVSYSGFSWVENVKGHIPLSDSVFFTPRNSISLKYTSSTMGKWEVQLNYPRNRGYVLSAEDRNLSFRLYISDLQDHNSLPKIGLLFGDSCSQTVELQNYMTDLPQRKWIHVEIPIADFLPSSSGDTLKHALQGVILSQSQATGVDVSNHLYLDQIEITGASPPKLKLAYPAVLTEAKPYEKHVKLTWQLPLNPNIRYIKIYRSRDKENYTPIGITPVFASSFADMVPASNRTYFYKITWVDHNYEESPFSHALEARTSPLSDDQMLNMIQAAHISFFVERTEVNSGMHALTFSNRHATVSVQETGYSLLAHLVGVERDFSSFNIWYNRLEKITDFLMEAEHYYGVFPSFFDGRTGRGVFDNDSLSTVSLKATAMLIQGLLVSSEYLKSEKLASQEMANGSEKLQEKIQHLWTRIDWTKFALDEDRILYDRWSPVTGFKYAIPLGGFNDSFSSYILALAAPKHAISQHAYAHGLGVERTPSELTEEPSFDLELIGNPAFDVTLDRDEQDDDPPRLLTDRYDTKPFIVDTLLYGLEIPVGTVDRNLLETFAIFLAFNPKGSKDMFTDYGRSVQNLTEAYKRRDNEMNAGNYSLEVWGTQQGVEEEEYLPELNPAISAASYPFNPEEAIQSIRSFYGEYGRYIYSELGFRNWINFNENVVSLQYNALNQAAVAVMIENGRSGLIWDLYMNQPDIVKVLKTFFERE